jgi:TBC1 domain family protein 5
LLFGREFAFDAVLSLWDLLFAERLTLALVDMTCVAMLLRIRWQRRSTHSADCLPSIANCSRLVLDADYSTALSLLLRYSLPRSPGGTAGLVEDAVYLDRNRSSEAGATVIKRHSGRSPETKAGKQASFANRSSAAFAENSRRQERSQPQLTLASSPNRLSTSVLSKQKGLETLFQEVSGEVQRRTEGWSIARAVKGAVGEVKRNVQNLQPETSAPSPRKDPIARANRDQAVDANDLHTLVQRIQELEDRNKILAKMLGTALESLREHKESATDDKARADDESFNITLAKVQFVQVYLADSEIPIPAEEPQGDRNHEQDKPEAALHRAILPVTEKPSSSQGLGSPMPDVIEKPEPAVPLQEAIPVHKATLKEKDKAVPRTDLPPRRQQRPSLAESSFSFMLGEGRHRSSFVSSASTPPEQRRGSDPKSKPKQAVVGEKEVAAKGTESEDDGFTMSSLRGSEKGQ